MKSKKLALLLSFVITLTPVSSLAEGLGVCSHVAKGYDEVKNYEVVENADIDWVRDECTWSSTETSKGILKVPENVKRYYQSLHESGRKVLLVLGYGANSYYTLSSGSTNTTTTIPTSAEEEYMTAWKNYVTTVVDVLGEYVDAYEVWNEPDMAFANDLIPSDSDNVSDYEPAAEAYVDCYVNTKEILDVLQPGKPVLFGCKCTGASSASTQAFYNEMTSVAAEMGKTFDEYVDDVSIHFYFADADSAANRLDAWETTFDNYGFTGNVWLTETGLSETAEESYTQEEYLPMVAIAWDNYIRENSREGVAFWYDLRNDSEDSSDYESNFGLVDYNYNEKDLFKAMQARNKAVNYMELTDYQTPKTGSSLLSSYYGVLATYSDGVSTTYAGYDPNGKGGTVTVTLTGEKAYLYDYLGNVTELDVSAGTYDMTLETTVSYVVCVNPRTELSVVEYDEARTILTVKGKLLDLTAESVEIALTDESGNKTYSETVAVTDGEFETFFTPSGNGTFTLTAGADIDGCSYASETVVITGMNEAVTLGDSAVSVSDDKVTITGAVNGATDGETVSVLVVAAEADLTNLKEYNIAYVDDVTIENGAYTLTFTMPEKSDGEYSVLLAGANIDDSYAKAVTYGTASGYVNVCSFEYTSSKTTAETVKTYKEVWSEDFEGDSVSTAGTNQAVTAVDGNNVLGGNAAYTMGGVSLPEAIVFAEGDKYKLTYDFRKADGNTAETSVMIAINSTPGNEALRFGAINNHFTSFGWGWTGTESSVAASTGAWYNCELIMDYDAQNITYTVYQDGASVYTASESWNTNFTQLASVGLYFAGGSGAYIDNIVLSQEVEETVTIEEQETITITAGVNNPLATEKNCEILVIQYNENGALVDVSVTDVTVEANVVQAIEKTATVTKAEGAATAKAFIWDSLGNMYPLVNGLPITLN